MTTIGLIGVPTSAGAYAPGQERAPAALRDAGLVALLSAAGGEVVDHGDRAVWRWRPDPGSPRAQNAGQVTAIVGETTERVAAAATAGELTVVLGGDCTVGIGTVAGHVRAAPGERIGVVYFDLHPDLNVPAAVRAGALDWMGVAHMLAQAGAVPELVDAGPRLDPDQVLLFAWGPEQATGHERDAITRLGLANVPVDDVAADPAGMAAKALTVAEERWDRLLIHFDVDVIDFTDAPLSEETGRNQGLPYATALAALRVLLACPRVAALTVTELNPLHAEAQPGAVRRLARDLAAALAGDELGHDAPSLIGDERTAGSDLCHATAAAAAPDLRHATAADAELVSRLLVDFNTEFDEPAPEAGDLAARVRELLAGQDTVVLLAEHSGDAVGLAVMRFRLSIWTPGRECYLAELYVVPDRRGAGIGRALMEHAMEVARAAGCDHIDLGTAETATAARALYESLGFDNHEGRPGGPVNFFYEREL